MGHDAPRLGVRRPAGEFGGGDGDEQVTAATYDGVRLRVGGPVDATAVDADGRVRGTFGDGPDWYALELSAGDHLRASLAPDVGRAAVSLYGPGGRFLALACVGGAGTASLDGIADAGGTYALGVLDIDAVGGYVGSVTRGPPRRTVGPTVEPLAPPEPGDGYDLGTFEPGDRATYRLPVDPGRYRLVARVAAVVGGAVLAATVDGEAVGRATVPRTGGRRVWRTVTPGSVRVVDGGERTLRLSTTGTACRLDWVGFVPTGDAHTEG